MTADGSTVLERAMIEHNLAAASKLYMNIYSEELGQLLGTSAEKAERVAARMIAEERLQVNIFCGYSDHVHGSCRQLPFAGFWHIVTSVYMI